MKRNKQFVVSTMLVTIMLLTFLAVENTSAAPPYVIGSSSYLQPVPPSPYESNPTASGSTTLYLPVGSAASTYDGDVLTNYNFAYAPAGASSSGWFEVKTFDNAPSPTFTIGRVDAKMVYKAEALGTTDDRYRIILYVGATPTAANTAILQEWTNYGEYVYKDTDTNGIVSLGDVRKTIVGMYAAGTTVAALEKDLGRSLVSFGSLEKHRDNATANGAYDVDENIYYDADNSGTVTIGDTRLLLPKIMDHKVSTGTIVKALEKDIGGTLIAFASNEKHIDNILVNSKYDFSYVVYPIAGGQNTGAGWRPWSSVREPNDGVWDWTDIGNVHVRVETQSVGASDGKKIFIYEVWLDVYSSSFNPATGISFAPNTITNPLLINANNYFYGDVYATNVVNMWGYQYALAYDTNILSCVGTAPVEPYSYYPFDYVHTFGNAINDHTYLPVNSYGNVSLYVSGLDNAYAGWTRGGISPYLDIIDGDNNVSQTAGVVLRPIANGTYLGWIGGYNGAQWNDTATPDEDETPTGAIGFVGVPTSLHEPGGLDKWRDADDDDRWDVGEPAIRDVNANGVYNSGVDIVLAGVAPPDLSALTIPPPPKPGKAIVRFYDKNLNTDWDVNEPALNDTNGNTIYDPSSDLLLVGSSPPGVGNFIETAKLTDVTSIPVSGGITNVRVIVRARNAASNRDEQVQIVLYNATSGSTTFYNSTLVEFYDTNANTIWNIGEPAIRDVNSNGVYNSGTDVVLAGAAPPNGATLKIAGTFDLYYDANSNGIYDIGEVTIRDVNNNMYYDGGVDMYYDANSNNGWSFGEPAIRDVNANGVYNSGVDIVLAGSAPSDGVSLTSPPYSNRYYDADSNGIWSLNDPAINDTNSDGYYNGGVDRFRDANSNGIWDVNEPAIRDVNNNKVYNAGVDVVLAGVAPADLVALEDPGFSNMYYDADYNGIWDVDEAAIDDDGDGFFSMEFDVVLVGSAPPDGEMLSIPGTDVVIIGTAPTSSVILSIAGTDYVLVGSAPAQRVALKSTGFRPTGVYTDYRFDWPLNPATGSAWTWAQINGLQTGVKSLQGAGTWEAGNQLRVTQMYVEVSYADVGIGDFTFEQLAPGDVSGPVTLDLYSWQPADPTPGRASGNDTVEVYLYNPVTLIYDLVDTVKPINTSFSWTISTDLSSWLSTPAKINNAKIRLVKKTDASKTLDTIWIDAMRLSVVKKTWSTSGRSPYLDAIDYGGGTGNYTSAATNGAIIGDFGFPDVIFENLGKKAYVQVYAKGDGDDQIEVWVYDGTSYTLASTLTPTVAFGWLQSADIGSKLTTKAKINDARVYLRKVTQGAEGTVIVDAMRLDVYTGVVSITRSAAPGTTYSLTGNSSIARLYFKVLAYGSSEVKFALRSVNTIFTDPLGNELGLDVLLGGTAPANGVALKIPPVNKYYDADSDNVWDVGEPAIRDANNNGVYESTTDVVLVGSAPSNGVPLKLPANLDKYHDANTNNIWDVAEPAIRDVDNSGTYNVGDFVLAGVAPVLGSALKAPPEDMYYDANSSGVWDVGESGIKDINGNNKYDSGIDIVLVGSAPPSLATLTPPGTLDKFYDANSDGAWSVNEPAIRDVNDNGVYDYWVTFNFFFSNKISGDSNGDGNVNSLDIGALNGHWAPAGGAPAWSLGYDRNFDCNDDGYINSLDVGVVNANWGKHL